MKTFVLVHGSHGGGWVWKYTAAILRTQGHTVYTPTLTGLSDRAHLLGCSVNLSTHIKDITNLLEYDDLKSVILVGNSYGGMVISGVAAHMPERLQMLVYLDAYLPDDGQSEQDLWPPQIMAGIEKDPAARLGYRSAPQPEAFGITDPDLAAWARARFTPQPLATYTEPVPPGNAESAALPRVFIHCTGSPSQTSPFFGRFAAKARAKGWPVIEINAEHMSMLTSPQETAEQLLEISYMR